MLRRTVKYWTSSHPYHSKARCRMWAKFVTKTHLLKPNHPFFPAEHAWLHLIHRTSASIPSSALTPRHHLPSFAFALPVPEHISSHLALVQLSRHPPSSSLLSSVHIYSVKRRKYPPLSLHSSLADLHLSSALIPPTAYHTGPRRDYQIVRRLPTAYSPRPSSSHIQSLRLHPTPPRARMTGLPLMPITPLLVPFLSCF